MSSREKDSKSPGQKPADRGVNEESYEGPEPGEPHNGRTVSKETESPERPAPPSLDSKNFSKLLVVNQLNSGLLTYNVHLA